MAPKVNETEIIKARSDFLHETLKESMADEIGGALANRTLRLTTRQSFQYHGIERPRTDQRHAAHRLLSVPSEARTDAFSGTGPPGYR